jgi:hypothetical protein
VRTRSRQTDPKRTGDGLQTLGGAKRSRAGESASCVQNRVCEARPELVGGRSLQARPTPCAGHAGDVGSCRFRMESSVPLVQTTVVVSMSRNPPVTKSGAKPVCFAPPRQTSPKSVGQVSRSMKPSSVRERPVWRSLRNALASIWRIRSRVTANCLPTSSRV